MRIPSGKTDQVIFFVAVDSTDLVTRETGLSGFTVYRSRNGGTATVYTTPTITQLSSSNMPGVYSLLIDEDTTIASTSDSEEYCVHITCTGMAPVTRTIELYRRDTTTGRTLDVSAGGEAGLDWANIGSPTTAQTLSGTTVGTASAVTAVSTGGITAGSIATDAIGAAELATDAVTEIVTAVWAAATRTLTANTNLGILDAAAVRSAIGLASANLDTQLTAIDDFLDTEIAAIKAKTDNLPTDPADASDISGSFSTVNSTLTTIAGYLDTEIAAIKAKTDNLPASPAATGDIPSAGAIADAVWDEALSGHATGGTAGAALAAAGGGGADPETIASAVWDAILGDHVVTDSFGEAIGNLGAGSSPADIAAAVWDLPVTGHTTADTFGDHLTTLTSRDEVTPALIAEGVWDSLIGDHNDVDTFGQAVGGFTPAAVSYAVWEEVLASHVDAGTAGAALGGTYATVDTEIAAIKAKTDNLPSDPADASDIAGSFSTVNSTLSTIAGYIDTEVAAIKAKTDLIPASPASTGDIPTANQNADALLDRANGVETGYTPRQTFRIMSAVLAGKSSGHPGSPVYRSLSDSADRVSATVSSGNRSAVTHNP